MHVFKCKFSLPLSSFSEAFRTGSTLPARAPDPRRCKGTIKTPKNSEAPGWWAESILDTVPISKQGQNHSLKLTTKCFCTFSAVSLSMECNAYIALIHGYNPQRLMVGKITSGQRKLSKPANNHGCIAYEQSATQWHVLKIKQQNFSEKIIQENKNCDKN